MTEQSVAFAVPRWAIILAIGFHILILAAIVAHVAVHHGPFARVGSEQGAAGHHCR